MVDAKATRRYQAGIERALALFDATNEWADYIAFLSRLYKSLQGPPPDVDLPLKSTIARHLAQCLRQTLPSGVHQKALEVYDLIFSIVGQEQLAKDLSLYLPGLSHTLSFASLTTRPQFLAIYDDHILVLPAVCLRPAIRALIMSLLPGIEEETSEDFERTLSTFNRLRQKFVDDGKEEVFWQNLFLASITSPHRRAGVLAYLIRHLPKLPSQSQATPGDNATLKATEATRAIVTPEPGLLVRCFATGLQDPQSLVQRGFLDLLVSNLPLDATVFANNSHASDLDVLVNASAAVVLRRDMGLNRRLWAWYTGSEIKGASMVLDPDSVDTPVSPTVARGSTQNAKYFAAYGLTSLVRSISAMLNVPSQAATQRARPFRIALSLMDKWEIGGPTIELLFVPLLQSLQIYQESAPSQEAFDEVFRAANVFFDGVESKLITGQMLLLLEKRDLDLVQFIVANFNLEEEDMLKTHIPLICIVVVENMHELLVVSQNSRTESDLAVLEKLGHILEDLISLMPPDILRSVDQDSYDTESVKKTILQLYALGSDVSGKAQRDQLPTMNTISGSLLSGILECLQLCLSHSSTGNDFLTCIMASMDQCIALTDGLEALKYANFPTRSLENIQQSTTESRSRQYQIITGITSLITTLNIRDPDRHVLQPDHISQLIPALIERLWYFLLPSTPQYHVEAVESIWRLHVLSKPLRLAESTVIALMVDTLSQPNSREQSMGRFSTLWIHSRSAAKSAHGPGTEPVSAAGDDVLDLLLFPLVHVIDAVDLNLANEPCSSWIKSLTSINSLFAVVFQQMPKDLADSSGTSISLERLKKLITLAKSNDTQWKAFSGKTGHRESILELCSSLTSNQAVLNSLGVEALQVVHSLIGNDETALSDDILKMLSVRLVASYEIEQFQDALLDTLQAAFSISNPPSQPEYLLSILLDGISSPSVDSTLDKWVTLLCTIVPLLGASTLFSNLLKITSCFCTRIDRYHDRLQMDYAHEVDVEVNGNGNVLQPLSNPEKSISNLLSGVEYILARAHHQASLPTNEQGTGQNGVNSELPSSRSFANDHLTVVLCMQDALKVCSRLWLWRSKSKAISTNIDTKSLNYMASRLRARGRRILENLVEAEPQECLETLMGLWVERCRQNSQQSQILELLQTLDGARPKFMMPATFNAVYNRTNPGALDQSQKSSLSVNINAFELIAFLNDYTSALEDDLLDEIWTDCTTFLKEVLSNPMPHRQILFKLLEFMAVLCRKMENTNFGEETRMRKELADLCTRLFAAIFTIKPQGYDGSGSKTADVQIVFDRKHSFVRSSIQPSNALQALNDTLPDLSLILSPSDRLTTVYNGIASNITGPLLHSRTYPQNISAELLVLLQTMSTAPAATKAWKKDVTDAFNDAKFFQTQDQLIEFGWIPLIRQLVISDKTILPDHLSRLTPPAAAGLMFGVGASTARIEADRKTQTTLRRIALLLLSTEPDHFSPHLQAMIIKLEELLTATPESSPSTNSKADIYLMIRTIVLAFSPSQLSALWSIISGELRDLCNALISQDLTKFPLSAQLQGAKLLDLLLLLKPEEFQLHEWLFVTDTMDAIYPSHDVAVALADQIVLESSHDAHGTGQANGVLKKPWLCTDDSRDEEKVEGLLAAFFSNLSIRTFEDNYSLRGVDLKACREDVVRDVVME